MSPKHYLTYSLWLVLFAALALYAGTWGLAAVAETNGWQPGDAPFETAKNTGLAFLGATFLWCVTAMAAKRARDAHIPTLTFKAGIPAAVLLDHFALAPVVDDRLVGPFDGATPLLAVAMAGVFLLLLLAPRAPIRPLAADANDPAGLGSRTA